MKLVRPADDALLWEQFRAGDAGSLGELMSTHYTALLRYGTKFSRDTDFVRDCMQDVFVELWNRRATLSSLPSPQVRPYLMTMLRRLLHKAYVQRQQFDFQGFFDDDSLPAFAVSFTHEDQLIDDEKTRGNLSRIQQLLDNLPRRSKEVVYLRFYDNLDRPAIARIMGISEQSVSNLLQETLRLLRRHSNAEQFWLLVLLCSAKLFL